MMFTLLLAAASIDLVRWLDSLPYQVVGLCVAFTVVGVIWLLMECLGLVLRWWALGREEAAERRGSSHQDQITSEVSPVAARSALQPSSIGGAVPPEVIVVISAAVHDWIEGGAQIVSIVPLERMPEQVHSLQAWSSEGRRQHFASHKVR